MAVHYAPSPFIDTPELRPVLLTNQNSDRPTIGFKFLGGIVLQESGADQFNDQRIICMTQAVLGASNVSILNTWKRFGYTGNVSYNMGRIYNQLHIPTQLRQTRRSVLFAACLENKVFQIETPGNGDKFHIADEFIPLVVGIGRGLNDKQIAAAIGVSEYRYDAMMADLYADLGFGNRELYPTIGLMTGQISATEVWPRNNVDAASWLLAA